VMSGDQRGFRGPRLVYSTDGWFRVESEFFCRVRSRISGTALFRRGREDGGVACNPRA
jgi:hypothetical protein